MAGENVPDALRDDGIAQPRLDVGLQRGGRDQAAGERRGAHQGAQALHRLRGVAVAAPLQMRVEIEPGEVAADLE